ncbi:MAG: hypothetical protein U0Q19_01340 [Kineosporiaceae bacterium]
MTYESYAHVEGPFLHRTTSRLETGAELGAIGVRRQHAAGIHLREVPSGI